MYYVIALLVYWTSYGLGYLVSVVFKPHLSQLAAVVSVIVLFSQNGVTPTLPDYQKMVFPLNLAPYSSYLFFAQQATYVAEIRKYDDFYDINKSLDIYGYKENNLLMCIGVLIAYGMVFRILALLAMHCTKPNNFLSRGTASVNNQIIQIKNKLYGKVKL
jgi:hypothetical protein